MEQEHSELYEELRGLAPKGARAADMLQAAAEQIQRPGVRAGNVIAYCIREALMSLLDLGGKRQRSVSDAADHVVRVAKKVRDERASEESLLDAVQQLAAAREGPGPHIERLETLIGTLARRSPVRAKADLLDTYVELIKEVNALHGDVTFDCALDLYSRAMTTLTRLFGPMTVRLEEINPLTQLAAPGPEDVWRLEALAGDARTLSYFFGHLAGPGWLRALADHELLQPPHGGPWFAYGYISKLADSYPEEVRSWLGSRPSGTKLSDHQAYLLIAVARLFAQPVADDVLHLSEGRIGDAGVLHQIAGYLSELPATEHASDAIVGLIKRALDGVTREGAPADESYLSEGMLRVALSGARQGQARRWLRILTAKLAATCDRYPSELRRLQPIAGLTLTPEAPVFDQLVVAVRDLAHLAANEGVPTAERIDRLGRLPAPLAGRMIADHLIDTVELDTSTALALISEEVARHDPMPETLALARKLTESNLPDLDQHMLRALGDPPSAEETAAFDDEAELPRAWAHAFGWLIAMPASVREAWSAANERVERRWGQASANGFLWPEPSVIHVPPGTAIGVAALDPIEAARRIGDWKPTEDSGSASRHDAARELQELVNSEPRRWFISIASIVVALQHPLYAERYLNKLGEHADQLRECVPDILAAVEFAEHQLTTEPAQRDRAAEADWASVVSSGIDLIRKLAAENAHFGPDTNRGWELIERAVHRPDEEIGGTSPQHVMFGHSTRALGTAFVYADATTDEKSEPTRLLALLDEVLNLGPPDGVHPRAAIARTLPWLASRAAAWTRSRWGRLVGEDAPAGLGPRTFDQYLEWGAPFAALLAEHHNLYEAAVARVPDHARRHLLHALIWGVDGYDDTSVLTLLMQAGDAQVAEALQWLAFGAFHRPGMPLQHAIEFFQRALEHDMPASTYEPLGWLSRVDRLDGDTWLELTLKAARAAGGQLAQANSVAKRATGHPNDERAIRIVAALLGADLKLWHLDDIGRAGLELVNSQDPNTKPARDELREQLLQREFFDAYDQPDA